MDKLTRKLVSFGKKRKANLPLALLRICFLYAAAAVLEKAELLWKTLRGKQARRLAACALSLCMVANLLPMTAFAAETTTPPGSSGICGHVHDEECGYIEAVEGAPCSHLNEDGTYSCAPVLDSGVSGNATPSDADYVCGHEDGCGYTEAVEGADCTHSCELCDPTVENPPVETPPDMDAIVTDTCICDALCTEGVINPDCPVCSAEGADLTKCIGTEQEKTLSYDEVVALFEALPSADSITDETTEEEKDEIAAQITAALDAFEALSDEDFAKFSEEHSDLLAAVRALQTALINDTPTPLVDNVVTVLQSDGTTERGQYTTLADAIAAAQSGDTLKITADITLTTGVTISGKSLTLNLNGKTITYGGSGNAISLSNVAAGLTVTDGGSGGTVSATSGNAIYNDSTGAVVVEGGTVSAAGSTGYAIGNTSTGTVTVTDGTVSAAGRSGRAIFNLSTGAVNISGGAVSATGTTGIAIYNTSTGKITISGSAEVTSANTSASWGTIYLDAVPDPAAVVLEIKDNAEVTNTATDGYSVYFYPSSVTSATLSSYYSHTGGTVGRVHPEAAVTVLQSDGTTERGQYTTLADAIAAAQSGDTLKITADITLTTGVTISGKSLTLNLNGKTITYGGSGNAISLSNVAAGLTVTDGGSGGTVSATSGNAIYNDSTGAVVVEGGTVSAAGSTGYAIGNTSTGTVTVTDGTVSAAGRSGRAIFNLSTGAVNISGGAVSATGTTGIAIYNTSTGKITISGSAEVTSANTSASWGTIYLDAVPDPAAVVLEIKDNAEVTNTATDGYSVYFYPSSVTSATLSSYYSHTGGTVGRVHPEAAKAVTVYEGSTTTERGQYDTLADAITAANTGDTLKITDNIDLGDTGVTISGKSLTLDLNGQTITHSGSGPAITLTGDTGAGLTVTDDSTSGKLEVASNCAIWNLSTGTVTVEGGTVSATNSNGVAIYNSSTGTVTVSGGTVSAIGDSGSAIKNYSTGTIKVTGGTVSATGEYGTAIWNNSIGKITISGGEVKATTGIAIFNANTGAVEVSGTAVVTSKNTGIDEGTIYLNAVPNTAQTVLEITGGTVENTASSGDKYAVYFNDSIGVTSANLGNYYSHTGGTVGRVHPEATVVELLRNGSKVSEHATLADAITAAQSGDTLIITSAIDLGEIGVTISDKSLTLDLNGHTITYSGNGNAITLESSAGLTVTDGGSGGKIEVTSSYGTAIENVSTGTVTVSGGTVSAAGSLGIAIYNGSTGKITISGTAQVTGANTSASSGTIDLNAVPNPAAVALEIKDNAKVENTASNGYSVYFHNNTGVTAENLSDYYTAASTATVGRVHPEAVAAPTPTVEGKNIYANGAALIIDGTSKTSTTIYVDADRDGVLDAEDKSLHALGIDNAPADGSNFSTGGWIVYGGSHNANLEGDTQITLLGGYVPSLCGGGCADTASANVTGSASIRAVGGEVWGIYGGGRANAENTAANVGGGTSVVIGDSAKVNAVYGGGTAYVSGAEANVAGTAAVTVTGGRITTLYGGGVASGGTATVGATNVSISGGTLNSSTIGGVYGGGLAYGAATATANVTGTATVSISGSAAVDTNIYGGGYSQVSGASASVNGAATVSVSGNAVVNADIYGGGRSEAASAIAAVGSGSSVTVGGNAKIGGADAGIVLNGGTGDTEVTNGVASFEIDLDLGASASVYVKLPTGIAVDTAIATGAVAGDAAKIKLTGDGATGKTAEFNGTDKTIVVKVAGTTTPTVTSVSVSPSPATVQKGGTQQFTATVSGTNNPAQTVRWTVTGGKTGTSISTGGLLTVISDETAATLTVTATSTVDTSKSGTAAVTVQAGALTDAQKLAMAKSVIEAALDNLTVTNATTAQDILGAANAATLHGVTVEWSAANGFSKTNATANATGSITGTLKLTLGGANGTVTVNKVITKLSADKSALTAAIAAANSAKNGVTVNNGSPSSVANGTKFVTSAEMEALNNAIAAAQAVVNSSSATAADITAAVSALNGAVAAFNSAVKTGTYTGSSSSGSSGSSGGSGGGTVTPPTETKPSAPTESEIKVDGKVDANGNISVDLPQKTVEDAIKKAEDEARRNGNLDNGVTLVLNVSSSAAGGKTANSVTVNLPKTTQETIISNKIVNTIIVVNNPDIKIGIDLSAVKSINTQANADVNITATRLNGAGLTGAAKAAIGSRPVFDLKVNYGGGKQVTSFGGGSVSVAIPYTLGAGEKAGGVYAVYVDGSGTVQWLTGSVYDAENKVLRFSTNHFSTYGVGYKAPADFTDIVGHWAKDDIQFVVNRGLLSGTGAATFSPNTAMTRGMFVTALGRLAGADVSGYKQSSFTDVKADAYYMGYVEWAAKNGIVKGTTATTFAPDDAVTREQMAVIMANYAKAIGFELPKAHAQNTFADAANISSWAADSVKAMQMAGVLAGKNENRFDPQGTATRAEAAATLRRFVELMIDASSAQGWMRNDDGQWMYYESGQPIKNQTKNIGGENYSFNAYGVTLDFPKKKTGYGTYTVQAGDNFWLIAKKHNVSMDTLAEINGKTIYSVIHPGDVLKIPQ